MNAITKTSDESSVLRVMRDALYPGAREDSVRLVLDYCRARGLDPLKKPVHIVPMWVDGGYRDVPMPGINSYRVDAARTGEYDGKSEPEFGPDVTRTFAGKVKNKGQWEDTEKTVTFPAWCKVTVMRRGKPFVAKEFWTENYATMGKSEVPNEMWAKRPYGQLAKCAEAQALRMAFPEETGGQPTAEEMEGKTYDAEPRHVPNLDTPREPAPAGSMRAEAEAIQAEPRFPVIAPNGQLAAIRGPKWIEAIGRALGGMENAEALSLWRAEMGAHLASMAEAGHHEMVEEAERLMDLRRDELAEVVA